jgi:hypothetical protein
VERGWDSLILKVILERGLVQPSGVSIRSFVLVKWGGRPDP